MGDLQMLPLHTKVTWSGRGDMVPIQHRGSGPEAPKRRLTSCTVSPSGGRGLAWRLGAVRWLSVADGVPMTTTAHPSAVGAMPREALEAPLRRLVAAGDLDGIMRLYAADAVVSLPRGREAAGSTAIRAAFAAALAAGVAGPDGSAVSSRAVVTGDLAMTTSTTRRRHGAHPGGPPHRRRPVGVGARRLAAARGRGVPPRTVGATWPWRSFAL